MCAVHVLKTGDFDHTQRDQERKKNNHCSPGSPNIHEVFPHTRFFFLHNINTSARQTGKIRTYSSAFPLCSPTFPTTPERVLNLVSFMSKCCFRIAHSQFSSYSSLFKGRFWYLSTVVDVPRKPSPTVAASMSRSSTQSQSRRGTQGTPPVPCGWEAGCRRGRLWTRKSTSRRTL